MQKIFVSLRNCYGIKELDCTFDFTSKRTYSVYAPNGVMKTSFAKTFRDLSHGETSKELVFPERTTVRLIKNENAHDVQKEHVFVMEPYNETFDSEKKSLLLVKKPLKDRYDAIHMKINSDKEAFLRSLRTLSGLSGRNNNIELSIGKAFGNKQLFDIIVGLESTVKNGDSSMYKTIVYDEIFNDKVETFLKTHKFRQMLKDYIDTYNELLESSVFLKRGFNHYQATTVQKNLDENGFFAAKHSVNLFDGTAYSQVKNGKEFETIINTEKERVLNNKDLQEKFEAIDKMLSNTKELRRFRDYLLENKEILIKLTDVDLFRQELWVSYFIEQHDLYSCLLHSYKEGKTEIDYIVQQAKQQRTEWEDVIAIFNKRFSVPFVVQLKNQEDVILKSSIPAIEFVFKDNSDEKVVTKGELLSVLSRGEQKALYILNIIFEVEARKKMNQQTVFVIDDIADSFDYKNKYAIIEYLKDISEYSCFCQIVLTHNFDFHRTVSSRLDMQRDHRLTTIKGKDKIILVEEKYQNNPFEYWKMHLDNDAMLIASIPFVRNIAQYTNYLSDYLTLTSLLHIKQNTNTMTIADLADTFKRVLNNNTIVMHSPEDRVVDRIYSRAESIIQDNCEIVELENKIVLAIAIRLKAEQYAIMKIQDDTFVDGITKNQTSKLIKKYKLLFPQDEQVIKLLELVNLMTPENIHINSFMYEPILDMSNEHLKQLFRNVNASFTVKDHGHARTTN